MWALSYSCLRSTGFNNFKTDEEGVGAGGVRRDWGSRLRARLRRLRAWG